MKNKLIKVLCVCLVALTLLNVMGCNKKNKKYDVTMRIETSMGEYWIFTPDIDRMEVEIRYDGKERKVFMAKYNIPNDPAIRDGWITPSGIDASYFLIPDGGKLLYTDLEGKQSRPYTMKERGVYSYHCTAKSLNWNERSIILTINII